MSAVTYSPMADHSTLASAEDLVRAVEGAGGTARALGGIAVAMRCSSARDPELLGRKYSDLDLATSRKSSQALSASLAQLGYVPEQRFNALHGHKRLMFDGPDGLHVDVFVDQFVMCHTLDLAPRLGIHESTLSLADLLLTKLQVAELTSKDVTDAAALLLDHPLTEDEAGINVRYITDLLRGDWGWWRTVSRNLDSLAGHLARQLSDSAVVATVCERVQNLVEEVERAPKTIRWKARARAGERLPWRDEPEESH